MHQADDGGAGVVGAALGFEDDSGIGCQVMATDINKDGKPDINVGNKKGCFVHIRN